MLLLTEGQEGLWERFQHGDVTHDALALDHASVLPRWHRSVKLGVRPDGAAHPIAVRGHELVTRRDAALGMLADASGVIDAVEQEVAARGLLTVVADASGVIVRAHGGDAFRREVKTTRLVEGVRWDEAARGTNAIGTALAERQPVAVVGRGHWESVNHGLFCYAAPVIDPLGQLVAVVDVTGPLQLDSSAIGAAVRSATAAMEQILRAKIYASSDAGSRRLVERMVEKAAMPAVIVEAAGVITARNTHASAELDLPPGPIPVERLFGVGWSELARAAATGTTVFETKRRSFAVDFEPVFAGDQLLALVCFFEGIGRRAPIVIPEAKPLAPAFDRIFATDPPSLAAKQLAARLAPSEIPVLLLAETGTGKELFAQAIHRASPRATHPFVAVNCGALTGSLLESELFGYGPGAFTGARPQGADGKIAAAHRGTLFLDEVAEMSPAAQAMLLRFLEDGSYSRVGEATPRKSDIRLVCATCRDLPKLVTEGTFRQDLFFRIQGGCVKLPPLRERTDRVALARELARPKVLGASAESWILDHSWPGNIRELKTAIVHAAALSDGPTLEQSHFPCPLLDLPPPTTGVSRRATMHAMAEQAVARAGGNLSEAARALGVARSTLYRMLGR